MASRTVFFFLRTGLGLLLSVLCLGAAAHDDDKDWLPDWVGANDWPMFGQNIHNTAQASPGSLKDVAKLKPKWTFTAGGEISARAAIVDGRAYFPDWGGNLWAVDTKTGKKVWGHALSDYGLPANTHSRTSPAVNDGVVYIGTQEGAWLLAIDAAKGKLLWKVQLESPANDPLAMITASPAIVGDLLFTGVASNAEGLAGLVPGFVCCGSARGSVVAVTLKGKNAGKVLWKTYMTPPGYTGAGVWSSNFAIDLLRGTVYASTGNNYSAPTAPAYLACIAGGATQAACASPDNHVDSIVALNMLTGKIRWAKKFVNWNQPGLAKDGSDDWNVDCFMFINGNCPAGAGPDYDFASAPNLIHYRDKHGRPRTLLGAGQKSGIYYALDPDDGRELWRTQVGPGSSLGGMEWGSASDGRRIYVSIANFYGIPTQVGAAGSWAALEPETGKIIWQVGDPNGSIAIGPLTVADGVVFASSMAGAPGAPTMLALDAASGQTLWSYAAGSSVNAGASVVDGVVYWGSGYAHLQIPGYTTNDKFFAFSKNGK
ncbi:PQQ-binding-like beta-propeller repeat protein [Paucibacter sp. R3-3]|uniref:PQQ-binding-like beta-propeller repeat protein n=1 Tax=Roseateles agri TaxID=3098619 RepID=A0ABU5DJI8_9BURK|nr:PQQ-binding-like beta-propeller repeat protein [Paucibacter sp. R3-3]MDY0746465.1 PQQ-binding-like beta-propeller repeat protein [Paucibacter sp. R3-3]